MAPDKSLQSNKSNVIIGIGASAAGLEALEKFFKNVPPDKDLSYVVIQHLLADQKSILSEILSKYTMMPVFQIQDDMEIKKNSVYVIPPGKDIEVTDSHFRVRKQVRNMGIQMPIDHFFRSMIRSRREKSIGIILSGTGSDGTLGIKDIKEEGGMVMVQTPETAGYSGMPQSAIDTGMVDFILSPEEMPSQIIKYVSYFLLREPNKKGIFNLADLEPLLKTIFTILKNKTGHDFSDYKRSTVFRRIEKRMTIAGMKHLTDYVNHLRTSQNEPFILFKELLIDVTRFFRDPESFNVLEKVVFPPLVERSRKNGIIRIWVTACATGEEAYTIAMLLHRYLEARKITTQIQIFSTDIDDHALELARGGKYPENIAEDVPPEILGKYFTRTDHHFQINKVIRDMIIFANQSLLKDPPYSHIDLITCRNLLIYLNHEAQVRIMKIFHYALNTGGFLMLGSSENINAKKAYFKAVDHKTKIFGKNDLPAEVQDFWNYSEINLPSRYKEIFSMDKERSKVSVREYTDRLALEKYLNPLLIINKDGEILYSVGRCREYFEFHVGEPDNNILNMANEGLKVPLANGLRKLNNDKTPIRYDSVKVSKHSGSGYVNVHLTPVEKPPTLSNLFMVYIEPVTVQVQPEEHNLKNISAYSEEYIREMERELNETRDYLQSVIEELQSTNEELKSSNEEIQSANEEMQSANEELETSKEELQSLNEELSTSNTELQRKIDEVTQVNNDINNLLSSIQIGTLFLNKELIIQRFTPEVKNIINLIDSDVGRPVANFVTRLDGSIDLIRLSLKVIKELAPCELEIKVDSRNYWMRILPYRTLADSIEGVVITFTDISELKRMKNEIEEGRRLLASIVESTEDAIYSVDSDHSIATWNQGAIKLYGYRPEEIIGHPVDILYAEDLPERKDYLNKPEEIVRTESFHKRKDNTLVPVSVTRSQVLDQKNLVSYVVKDNTWVKKREESILQEKKAAEEMIRIKTTFLENVSHEIRTPMNSILGFTELLRKSKLDTNQAYKVNAIMTSGKQLMNLVDDITDITRLDAGVLPLKKSTFRVEELLKDVMKQGEGLLNYENKKEKIQLKLLLPEKPESIVLETDYLRLQQILFNLLNNAFKYTDSGSVETGCFVKDDKEVILFVKDTGMGIEPAYQKLIFERFRQVNSQRRKNLNGTGLGLSIVQDLTHLLGGKLTLESEPGKGSAFYIHIPYSPGLKADIPRAPEENNPDGAPDYSGKRVLVVEDDPMSSQLLELMIVPTKATVITAKDGEEAMQIFSGDHIDLVLLDIRLPKMDGYQVLEKMKQLNPSVPVVGQSAHIVHPDKEMQGKLKFDKQLTKPISIKMIQQVFERYLK